MPRREQKWKVVATVSTFLLPDTIDKIGEIIMQDVCANFPADMHRIIRKESVIFEVGELSESQM